VNPAGSAENIKVKQVLRRDLFTHIALPARNRSSAISDCGIRLAAYSLENHLAILLMTFFLDFFY
jgi:hypothetical protein